MKVESTTFGTIPRDATIRATCHTADNAVCLEFDATPWFSEADAPSIVDLAQRGWSGAAIAESLERQRGYERLHDLIAYAAQRLQPESLEDPTWNTFECLVDGPEVMAWLDKNRPDVVARIRSQSRYQSSEESCFHEEELVGGKAADGIVWC
jgi:hypothetical protein